VNARATPIVAPTANVMATIWNGGIGPADTDSAARSAPQRDGTEARGHRAASADIDNRHSRRIEKTAALVEVTIRLHWKTPCSFGPPTR